MTTKNNKEFVSYSVDDFLEDHVDRGHEYKRIINGSSTQTIDDSNGGVLGDGNFSFTCNEKDLKAFKNKHHVHVFDTKNKYYHVDLTNKLSDLQTRYPGTNNFPIVTKSDEIEYQITLPTVKETYESRVVVPVSERILIKEQIKKLSHDAIIPVRGTKFSACKDLFSPIDAVVPAGKNLLIKTNLAIAWDNPEYYMQLLSRSGLSYKNNIVVQAGVIDFDYRANIGVLLQNNSDVDFVVKRNDRIAQYAYVKIITEESEVVEEFTFYLESNRTGGFGSTGK